MPKAYLIADVEITDPERYRQYTALSPAAVAASGGRFIARGGETLVMEGNWVPGRVVVVEFDSLEAARTHYDSALYREARARRAGATSRFNMIIVQGIPD